MTDNTEITLEDAWISYLTVQMKKEKEEKNTSEAETNM